MAKLSRCLRVAGEEVGQRSCAPLPALSETIRIMGNRLPKEVAQIKVVLEDA